MNRSTLRNAGVLLFGVVVIAFSAMDSLGQSQGPNKDKGVVPAAATAEQLSFDQPLTWMNEAKLNYSAVKDYTCTMVSQEKVNGKMGDQGIVQMKVLSQPFSVRMRWIAPVADRNQEVIYVKGKNDNKMLVKSPRALPNLLGWLAIPVNDPKVLQHSKHTIDEAGIGNMIDATIKAWEIDRANGKAKILPALAASYDRRECIKVEVVRYEKGPQAPFYRTVIYLEKASKMPIRLENYDWPQAGGPKDGEKVEEFSYINIEWNKGLKEADFNK